MRQREAGISARSINSRITGINAYLRWAEYGHKLAFLREEEKVLPTYKPEHLKKLINYKPRTSSKKRLHTLILTLLDTGIRVEEALSIRAIDVDWDNMLLKVMGKGNKERLVPFSYELRRILWRWKDSVEFDLLFASRNGAKLMRRNVLRDFKLLCRSLGFEAVPRSIHALRHTFAVNYLRNGGSVFHLQKALGHSSLEMSRKYANLLTEDLQQVQHKVSLLQRLR
jgi:site-specific recombinase XerD